MSKRSPELGTERPVHSGAARGALSRAISVLHAPARAGQHPFIGQPTLTQIVARDCVKVRYLEGLGRQVRTRSERGVVMAACVQMRGADMGWIR